MFAARRLALLTLLLIAFAATGLTSAAAAATSCTRYASPAGSDSAAGSTQAPFATAQKLVSSLGAGETGCLLPGTYTEDVTISRGGAKDSPITLTSAPGSRATLRGRLWVTDAANDVVLEGLFIDARSNSNLPSPTVNGDRVRLVGNEITNFHAPGICLLLGSESGWGTAVDPLVEGNRIHDCGAGAGASANRHHGIYLQSTRSARILGNWIYDNTDRGIQLYPDAQGTVIANNVIDGNGEGILFSGEAGFASSGSRVYGNVISNATIRYNVESWYPAGNPLGSDNLVQRNCVWNGKQGNVAPAAGFTVAEALVVADPQFVDRVSKDFRMASSSPCAGFGPTSAVPAPPPAPVAPVPVTPAVPVTVPAPAPVVPGSNNGGTPAPVPTKPAAPAPAALATKKDKPNQKQAPKRATQSASTTKRHPTFVRTNGALRIWWGGRYRTRLQLARHLASRGVRYTYWARKHGSAARALKTGHSPR